MIRVPIMTEEAEIYKQNLSTNFILAATNQIAVDGSDIIQVSMKDIVFS